MMTHADKKLRHSLAQLNPYHSVNKCFKVKDGEIYVGIKDVEQIPSSLMNQLISKDKYVLHTLDAHSLGGRAVDLHLQNPITGRFMTGSSSGTAINVLTYINDLGIGTDGGGSVLAPAMSLNLFGFISELIETDYVKQYTKESTDGISFSPSIGFMTRDYAMMSKTISDVLDIRSEYKALKIFVSEEDCHDYSFACQRKNLPALYADRKTLIRCLNTLLSECDVLLSYEGPVDGCGIGDTIFGHFDERTHELQMRANKGFIRVVNMVNATALSVPAASLGCAYVLICESKKEKIAAMLGLAEELAHEPDATLHRYFSNLSMYFSKGYQSEEEK